MLCQLRQLLVFFVLLPFFVLPLACTGEDVAGTGTVSLTMNGGASVREGFPHKEGEQTNAFVDGWTATFSAYIVAIGDVNLTDPRDNKVVAEWKGPLIVNMKSQDVNDGAPATAKLVDLSEVPAKRLNLGFSILTAQAGMQARGVGQEDLDDMIKNKWSVLFVGEAKKGEETVKFRLGLSMPTQYTQCTNGKDSTLGIAVESNKTTGSFIFLHGIHVFWDSLGSTSARLRFDAYAAVAGDDKVVTSDELKTQDLTALKDAKGDILKDKDGNQIYYDDSGLLPPGSLTLYDFLKFNVRDSIHFNGLGLCQFKALD